MEVYKTSFQNQPSVNISILNSSNQSMNDNQSPDLNQSSVLENQEKNNTVTTIASKHFIGGSDLSKKNTSNASINKKPQPQADNRILLALQATINTLYKKVHQLEKTIGREILGKLPADIEVLSTDEVLKRKEIAMIVQQADTSREKIDAELKRLRREHYTNIRSIENVETLFKQN